MNKTKILFKTNADQNRKWVFSEIFKLLQSVTDLSLEVENFNQTFSALN